MRRRIDCAEGQHQFIFGRRSDAIPERDQGQASAEALQLGRWGRKAQRNQTKHSGLALASQCLARAAACSNFRVASLKAPSPHRDHPKLRSHRPTTPLGAFQPTVCHPLRRCRSPPPWLSHGLPAALGRSASTQARPISCEFLFLFVLFPTFFVLISLAGADPVSAAETSKKNQARADRGQN